MDAYVRVCVASRKGFWLDGGGEVGGGDNFQIADDRIRACTDTCCGDRADGASQLHRLQ